MTDADPEMSTEVAEAVTHKQKSGANPWIKLAVDFVPLLLFFVVNGWMGIYWATGVFMAAMVAAIVAARILLGEVSKMLWVNAIIVLVFGSLTIVLHNDIFIKIKPTLLYGMFAVILFYGLWSGKPVMKQVLESAYPALTDEGWRLLSRNWAWFFLVMALINEFVWRSYSTDIWVAFKAWGVLPLSILFALLQTPILLKHSDEQSEGSAS